MREVKLCSKQNPPVLNWGYRLTQIVLYNGLKMVVAVAVAVVVVTVVKITPPNNEPRNDCSATVGWVTGRTFVTLITKRLLSG